MSFYESLFPVYDRIFPLNKGAESFLLELFNEEDSLLDIGAGTGSMAIALAAKGLEVTAVEPEPSMADAIVSKAGAKGIPVTVQAITMEQITHLEKKFDGIYCIGNTLPHLQNAVEIEGFLKACFEMLSAHGKLVLQTVNFDKFAESAEFIFPVIEKEDFLFKRKYDKDGDKILFTASLTSNGETKANSIPLFPITSSALMSMLERIGFKTIELYGSFKKDHHSAQSPAIVVLAHKTEI